MARRPVSPAPAHERSGHPASTAARDSTRLPPQVQRAFPADTGTVQHMGVDHRCGNILVAEQFLHGSDVATRLNCMSRKRMPQCVARCLFTNTRLTHRSLYGLLNQRLILPMPPVSPLRGSIDSRAAGNTYCHPGSALAFGYFSARACGSHTRPCPASRSLM